jgi:hypothetical protein
MVKTRGIDDGEQGKTRASRCVFQDNRIRDGPIVIPGEQASPEAWLLTVEKPEGLRN